ncbi:MAG: imelysin family protein [Hyphomicrobiaceae bacterium]
MMRNPFESTVYGGLVLVCSAGLLWAAPPNAKEVINTYADIALAGYEDSLATARDLQRDVTALIKDPSPDTLEAAREAWLAARIPYQQTEVYRFGNPIVDDWEGKVNAWPLDEGLIDYVAELYGTETDENQLYSANVIANRQLKVGGRDLEVPNITADFLSKILHEADGIEANVATGYHAIEFLLWGQDLNGTGPGKGNRPATDFDQKACTGGNCDRRVEYLMAVVDLLIEDLTWIVAQWKPDGDARNALLVGDGVKGIIAIFTGMGSLSYGELAGERMKLGLLLHDPEEEHDCFSDNTHNSHYYDVIGIQNIYLGRYERVDGSVVRGPSPSDLVKAADATVDQRLRDALANSVSKFRAIVERAETKEAYDQMIGEGNETGNAVVEAAIATLLSQTKEIERAIHALDLKPIQFEGSDSLNDPASVAQ